MKRYLLIYVQLFLMTSLFAQSTFLVKSGETYVIKKEEAKMLVDNWIMENNSKIIISNEVKTWEINASAASFGKSCRIIGRGKDGENGESSTLVVGTAADCTDGAQGGNGKHGLKGQDAANIKITMGLVKVTDLTIDLRGGIGGNGGDGTQGGQGGSASCGKICDGQEGGVGGIGGDAGPGGRGGNILIDYWIIGSASSSTSNGKGIKSVTKGGAPGKPGIGGKGGLGGAGTTCVIDGGFIKKTYKRGSGSPGPKGPNGLKKKAGKDGTKVYNVLPSPINLKTSNSSESIN